MKPLAYPRQAEGFLSRYEAAFGQDPDYIAETLALQVTEDASRLMRDAGVNRSTLATLMGVSPAHVTKVLNASPDLTLRSIAQLAVALGVKPRIVLEAPGPLAAPLDDE